MIFGSGLELLSFLLTCICFSKCQMFLFQKFLSLWSHCHINFKRKHSPKAYFYSKYQVLDDLVLKVVPTSTTRNFSSIQPAASLPVHPAPHSQPHSHPSPCLLAHLLSHSLLPLLLFPVFTHCGNSYPFLCRQFSLLSPFTQCPHASPSISQTAYQRT